MTWADKSGDSWLDDDGRRLAVLPADDSAPARLLILRGPGEDEPAGGEAFWIEDADPAEVAVAVFRAHGQPAPVITPRPDVDTSRGQSFGPCLRLSVEQRRVRLWGDGLGVLDELEPHAARQLAGLLVAYADAAESEPDPAEVEKLGNLIAEERGLAGSAELARKILRAGYQREARNG